MSSSEKPPASVASDTILSTSDYVLSVKYDTINGKPTESAQLNFSKLVKHLKSKGIYSQVRPGDENKLLLFVKAEYSVLYDHLKSHTLKDYVYGLKPEINTQIPENLSKSEKLRLVYAILTNPVHEGGAAITAGSGDWEFVEKITPLYDYNVTNELFQQLLKKPLIDESDILRIKEIAGEKVALYFAFARFYFLWLAIPSVLGFISHFFFDRFSIIFTILNSLWAIIFINAWKKQESIYATAWDTKGSSKVEITRAEYVSDTVQYDPSTPLESPSFKRTLRQYSFIPVAIFGGSLLLSYQFICFFIEIFLNEIYQGPGKAFLGLVPTVLIVVGAPYITAFYSTFIKRALKWENHETQSSYDKSFTQKLFVHNFLGSYAPLFITIFFYLPFGHTANALLPTIKSTTSKFGVPVLEEKFQVNNGRLIGQFSFFTVTGLVVGFLLENVVPVVIRLVKERTSKSKLSENDAPEEVEFLKSVRKQVSLPAFDADGEYRELIINFGYLAVFGPVWSLAPIFSLISAYVEIKGDLEKLLLETSRPVPVRVESAEPWGTNLKLLTWLGTIIGPLITSFFRLQDKYLASSSYSYLTSAIDGNRGWEAVTAALVSENISIFLNFAVESIFSSLTTKVERDSQQKNLKLRRSYVEAYAKESAAPRDIGTDSSEKSWSNFDTNSVIKQASAISYLISSPESKQPVESIPASNEKAGFKQFADDESNLQTRGATVASKTVPATDAPVPTSAPSNKSSNLGSIVAGVSAAVGGIAASASSGVKDTTSHASTAGANKSVDSDSKIDSGLANTSNAGKSATSGADSSVSSSSGSNKLADSTSTHRTSSPTKGRPLSSAGIATAVAGAAASVGLANKSRPNSTYVGSNDGDVESSSKTDKTDKLKKKLFGFGRKESTKKDLGKSVKLESTKAVSDEKTAVSDTKKADDSSNVSGLPGDFREDPSSVASETKGAGQLKSPEAKTTTEPSAADITTQRDIVPETATQRDIAPETNTKTATVVSASGPQTIDLPPAELRSPTIGVSTPAFKSGQDDGSGAVTGIAAGAAGVVGAIGGAIGLGSSGSKSASSDSVGNESTSHSNSLNGATLPPNFGSKKNSSSSVSDVSSPQLKQPVLSSTNTPPLNDSTKDGSKTLDPSAQQLKTPSKTSSTDNGIVAAASSLLGTHSKTSNKPQQDISAPSASTTSASQEGHPANTTAPESKSSNATAPKSEGFNTAAPETKSATTSAPTVSGQDSISPTKAALSLGGLTAAASGLAHKLSSHGDSHDGSSNNANTQQTSGSAHSATAKESAEKLGSTLNDYVQLAADKVEDYAAKSDNQYIRKGNDYVQKVADKSDEYAHQSQTQSQSQGQSQNASSPHTPVSFNPTTPSKNGTGELESGPESDEKTPSNGENTTSTGALGDSHNDTSLKPPARVHDSNDVSSTHSGSTSSPKKKNKFFKGLKDAIKSANSSAHSTPKKSSS